MFTHILVPLDGSELAECVLPHVKLHANAMGARVTLFHSLARHNRTPVNPVEWHMRKAQARQYLHTAAEKLKEHVKRVETVLVEGPAAESIIDYAHENNVDYMILSTHGNSGLTGWNISSVVQKVILRSYISTFLVRAYRHRFSDFTGYGKILLALDCSNRSENTLPMGVMLASGSGAKLIMSHVVRTPEMSGRLPPGPKDEELREELIQRNTKAARVYLRQLTEEFGSDTLIPEKKLLVGDNVAASLENLIRTDDIDLVIISAHGYNNTTEWPYGSVAVSLIVYGTVPLLIMQDVHHSRARRTLAEEFAGENSGH